MGIDGIETCIDARDYDVHVVYRMYVHHIHSSE